MADDDQPTLPVQRAIKRRKELRETVRAAMQELEKVEDFLRLYRYWSAPDDEEQKNESTEFTSIRPLTVGYGQTQPVFEQFVRAILQDVGKPLQAPEIIDEFRKRGHPLGGNEVKTAWNRLWKAKKSGAVSLIPRYGYWLPGEAIPESVLAQGPPKRIRAARADGLPHRGTGRLKGRDRLLSPAQIKLAETMFLEGKSTKEVGAALGGISNATLYNYFPGGPTAMRQGYSRDTYPAEKLSETQAEIQYDRIRAEMAQHQKSYQEGKPTVSDAEYDALCARFKAIEKRFPHLKNRS